jgi:hypothetical protein
MAPIEAPLCIRSVGPFCGKIISALRTFNQPYTVTDSWQRLNAGSSW